MVAVNRLKDGPADMQKIMCNQTSPWEDTQFTGNSRYFYPSKYSTDPDTMDKIDMIDMFIQKGWFKTERWQNNL